MEKRVTNYSVHHKNIQKTNITVCSILRAAELRLFKRKQKGDNVICDKVT